MWDFTKDEDMIEAAFGLIANAYGGDWELAQNKDWKPAAERWRDGYLAYINAHPRALQSEEVEV